MTEASSRLGLGLGVAPPGALLALVQELGRRVAVVDLGDAAPSDPALIRVEWDRAPARRDGGAEAWWLDDVGAALAAATERRPALVVSPRQEVVAAARAQGVPARLVPHAEVEPESSPVPPFVRERIRRARGLGEGLLVEDADGRWTWDGRVEVARETVATALAAAAAVYASSPHALVRGLAWGCPVVAADPAREQAGATHAVDCRADDGRDPLEQLRRLAADPRASAALSRAARARYEAAHSLTACADEVARRLGLVSRWAPSALQPRLDELDSRRAASHWRRFGGMVSSITNGGHG